MKRSDLDEILGVLNGGTVVCGADWYAAVGFLELNKMAGIFQNRAAAGGISLPQTVERRLRNVTQIQRERVCRMRRWIEDLSDELKFEGIRHSFLKGSVLANCLFASETGRETYLYEDGERVSNDVDLLVGPESLTAVDRVLKDFGFLQGYYDFGADRIVPFDKREILSRRMNRGETAPYLLKLDGAALPVLEVDVNFSADWLPNGREDLLSEMLGSVRFLPGRCGRLSSMDAEYFFLHLVMHQYKECTVLSMTARNKDAELYKFFDMKRMIEERTVDFVRLGEIARRHNLGTIVGNVLSDVEELFGCAGEAMLASGCKGDVSTREIVDPPTGRRFERILSLRDRMCLVTSDASELIREKSEKAVAASGNRPEAVEAVAG